MLLGSLVDAIETESGVVPDKRMRAARISVCHVASGDRWAGAEVQLATLLRGLAQREELRLTAILLNEGRLAEEARRCDVEVKILPESKKNFLQILSEAVQYVRARDLHILHSHRYKENLLAALLAWCCRVPFLVRTQHGMPEPIVGLKRYKQDVIQLVDRIVARYATDCVITVSADVRSHLTRYLSSEKVVTIHNGIDREQVRSKVTQVEAKRRLGIPEDCWLLGTAGRLEPVKRLDIFLAAVGQIAKQAPNTRFLIAGEGSEEAQLRALARTNGLEERVLFLGHREDIYDVLRALDVFVLCSDHEGMPMVLLEAFCLGVPVVARPVGGIAEVIQNGVNGVWVASPESSVLAEACLDLLADEVRRKSMVLAAANLVAEKFAAEHTAARLTKLYCSLARVR